MVNFLLLYYSRLYVTVLRNYLKEVQTHGKV